MCQYGRDTNAFGDDGGGNTTAQHRMFLRILFDMTVSVRLSII